MFKKNLRIFSKSLIQLFMQNNPNPVKTPPNVVEEEKQKEEIQEVKEEKEFTYEPPLVTDEDIAYVVSSWSGIPVSRITKTETQKLVDMEEILQQRVVGQKSAIASVAKAIRRARIGLKNPNRPIASFLFSGPTGVGKTELSKSLATYFFGSEDSLVRLDMSEFMERHTVAKLIGSPPGYVGYSEGGQLTEAVRRKPYALLLFDEIEKAHPDVFNLLLQVLDEGRLTDSKGRTIDFTNTLTIMTSNLGSRSIEKARSEEPMGFSTDKQTEGKQYEKLQDVVNEELKRFFRPEFLNRIDEIIVFQQLTRYEIGEIADIMLNQLSKRMRNQGMILDITRRAKSVVVQQGFDPVYGARPLRRAIIRLIEDKIASSFLSQTLIGDVNVFVDCNEGAEELTVTVIPTKKTQIFEEKLSEGLTDKEEFSLSTMAILIRYTLSSDNDDN